MKTILVANRKGGCGKTDGRDHTRRGAGAGGRQVALADADPQKSALRWLKARPAGAVPAIAGLDWTHKGDVGDAPKGLDWLVIDAPGALRGDAGRGADRRGGRGGRAGAALGLRRRQHPALPAGHRGASSGCARAGSRVHLVANRMRAGRAGRAAARLLRRRSARSRWPGSPSAAAYADLAAAGAQRVRPAAAELPPLPAQWAPVLAAVG